MGIFSKLFGPEQPSAPPSNAKRVLVVDASITTQKVIELTLTAHRLSAAASAGEGLAAVSREPFDLVISAVVLPDGTGYHVCREAKAKGLPVILMPGAFEAFDRAQAQLAGADAVVEKPFKPQRLVAEVDRLLAQKH